VGSRISISAPRLTTNTALFHGISNITKEVILQLMTSQWQLFITTLKSVLTQSSTYTKRHVHFIVCVNTHFAVSTLPKCITLWTEDNFMEVNFLTGIHSVLLCKLFVSNMPTLKIWPINQLFWTFKMTNSRRSQWGKT